MRALLVTALLSLSVPAAGVKPEAWRISSIEDFLAGENEGFAITATGALIPGPSVRRLAELTDPFVFSQTTGPDGSIYLGTGNDGRVYRFRDGTAEVLFEAEEPQVYALAMAGNTLFAATSPNGKIYRIDTRSGAAEAWADPEEAYLWQMVALDDGSLVVATGLEGRLLRIRGKDRIETLFEAPEQHLRSVVVRRDGVILAGGSGRGRIYEILPAGGGARALYDSAYTEISALYLDERTGTVWASAGTTVVPTGPPASSQRQQTSGRQSESGESRESDQQASASVSVSFSFDQGGVPQPGGSSELFRIDPDGWVQSVWRLEREIIYSIDASADGEGIIVSTGANGRIYRVNEGSVALIASVPEKQVVSYVAQGSRALATTTNGGAVYALDFSSPASASFRSTTRDTKMLSRFGAYRIDGQAIPSGISVEWRSGNTATPDDTWSGWSRVNGSVGEISAPPARYLQSRISVPSPPREMVIEEVNAVFVNRNVPPKIDSFSVAEPAVVFLSGGLPSPPGVVEATNPDQYGIFTSIDAPSPPDQGKKFFRKGFRTVNWKTSDANGDTIVHDLHFRRKGSTRWLKLRENLRVDQMNFDTSQLPDGEYELRLTASDKLDNPVDPLTTERAGLFFVVDNTAPVIRTRSGGTEMVITIEDAASPLSKVEYAVDAEEWKPLIPDDGIVDSRLETFRLPKSEIAGKFVVVRAVDSFYNVATAVVSE
jgi:hypothetical protein